MLDFSYACFSSSTLRQAYEGYEPTCATAGARAWPIDRGDITSAICDGLRRRHFDGTPAARRARRLRHAACESDVHGPGSERDRAAGGGQLRAGRPLLVGPATRRLGWSGRGHPVVGARPGCLVMV